MFVIDNNASVHGKRYSLYRKSCWITSNVKPTAEETTTNYEYHQEIDCFVEKGLKMTIPEEQKFYRWKVAYYDSFHLADQWNFSMIKMGPVSFGAALIAAPKSLNGSLDVTFFELEHRTPAFASWHIVVPKLSTAWYSSNNEITFNSSTVGVENSLSTLLADAL
jgi:hypothetical protein